MPLKSLIVAGALLALAVPGHAGTTTPTEATAAKKAKAAPEIAPPPPGMGQIVFYRPSSMGALISCRVHEAGQVVNKLPPGKYFVHQTAPGVHEYTVKSEATDVLRVNVEEGETQYARCAIGMGLVAGRPNLSTQSREDFDKRGKKLKLQPPFVAKDSEARTADKANEG